MKKTLLATAIAASMAAPAIVSAAGPTLYGQAHVSVEYLANDDEGSLNAASNSSRIGVKGAFDVGTGWQAIYLMEWEVSMTGDNAAENDGIGSAKDLNNQRNRYIGFKSDSIGTFVVGRHDTPMKVIGRKTDLFWSTQLGQNRTFTNLKDGGAGFDLRADNVLAYISPKWGPVSLFAAYVTDHNVVKRDDVPGVAAFPITDDNDFDAYSVAGIYDQKNLFGGDSNLYLALGYEQHNIKDPGTAGSKDSETALRVAGKFDFGNWSIPIFYQNGSDLGFTSGNDRDVYGGGLAYKMGANTLKGAVYVADDVGDQDKSGGMLYSLGVDHAMSKNVQVYANVAALQNDENASLVLGGSGHGAAVAGVPDKTSWGVSFGSRIKF